MTNSLEVQVLDSTSANTIVGPADNTASIRQDIENTSNWVDPDLAGVVGGDLGLLGAVLDPLGSLISWADSQSAGWLSSMVQPLNAPLDALAGNPGEIAEFAQAWTTVAQRTDQTRQDYADAVNSIGDWSGETATAHREQAAHDIVVVNGITQTAAGTAAAAANAATLIGGVRGMIAELIAECANTIAASVFASAVAAGVTIGAAAPFAMGYVAKLVATCAHKINNIIQALLRSLRRLSGNLDRLGDNLTDMTRRGRTRPRFATADGPSPSPLTLAMAKRDKGDKGKKRDDEAFKQAQQRMEDELDQGKFPDKTGGDGSHLDDPGWVDGPPA